LCSSSSLPFLIYSYYYGVIYGVDFWPPKNACNRNQWTFLERDYAEYDRENPILIEILKEGKLGNIGGWSLKIYTVYVEPWSYQIIKSNDIFGSEYVIGYISVQ
jgi:hypothetical protein